MNALPHRHLVFSPDPQPHWFCDCCAWAGWGDVATEIRAAFEAHDCACVRSIRSSAIGGVVVSVADETGVSPIGAAELLQRWKQTDAPMWVFDVHTLGFLAVNDAAIHKYGYSREQFLAISILDIRPIEDVIPLIRKELQAQTHNSDHEVWRHQKKDGSIIKVAITSREIMFEGHQAEVVAAVEIDRDRGTVVDPNSPQYLITASSDRAGVPTRHRLTAPLALK